MTEQGFNYDSDYDRGCAKCRGLAYCRDLRAVRTRKAIERRRLAEEAAEKFIRN